MSNIPLARQQLQSAYERCMEAAHAIEYTLSLMKRRKPDFRHSVENKRLTPLQRQKIVLLRRRGLSYAQIGKQLGIKNNGRISETLRGKAHV